MYEGSKTFQDRMFPRKGRDKEKKAAEIGGRERFSVHEEFLARASRRGLSRKGKKEAVKPRHLEKFGDDQTKKVAGQRTSRETLQEKTRPSGISKGMTKEGGLKFPSEPRKEDRLRGQRAQRYPKA